ncbi:hypothetical protein [Neobacillus sp. PS3-40]|uniref:hypothetical protein n=1 Tax=Neobacillus sp. PS3-40 TaxID=3070679 RepID=UPI0027E128E7|nr:hypothetical protein [Neobacillus sp. PS3-40]WML45104.1 hypothetical protein RCG20_04165 [Neobacillus sp. PS3-40]
MPYIIENATIPKGNLLLKKSFLISENRITAIQSYFKQYNFMRMNLESFIMTPSYVLLDTSAPLSGSFEVLKEYFTKEFILKGCTTLLTYINVSYERELAEKLINKKTALLSSPIDFLIGVRIPLQLLSVSLIRRCKKERVPAIFVEIQDEMELENIPWSWIREALFPFNCPLIPVLNDRLIKEEKIVLAKWRETMKKEKVPFINERITEKIPLPATVLNKIGLFPEKSCLMHGAEISYNLYLQSNKINNVDDNQLFHYHKDRLVVTVHKGNVIRAGKEVLFKPGNGEYIKVKTPSFFSFS